MFYFTERSINGTIPKFIENVFLSCNCFVDNPKGTFINEVAQLCWRVNSFVTVCIKPYLKQRFSVTQRGMEPGSASSIGRASS